MGRLLAVDPGTTQSGYVVFDGTRVLDSGVLPNEEMLSLVRGEAVSHFAVEMIASYGMAVGKDVFETCVWVGRFVEAWQTRPGRGPALRVFRQAVKLHLCHSPRAKDTNVRQALIDRLGAPGTKAQPGPTYGVKSHAWAALAVAVTAWDTLRRHA
jgi:hypothetical protein